MALLEAGRRRRRDRAGRRAGARAGAAPRRDAAAAARAIAGAARAGRRRRGDAAGCARRSSGSRGDALDRADPRRERHRQGAGRARDPRRVAAARPAVRRDQLRRDPGDAARVGAVRPPRGAFTDARARQARAVRGRRRRHAVPRRDRRAAARAAGQAAARAAGGRDPARRRHRVDQGRRPADRRDAARPRRRRREPAGSARICTTGSTSCRCAMPPLRERAEDIPQLARFFAQRHAARHQLGERRAVRRRDRGAASASRGRATCASSRT